MKKLTAMQIMLFDLEEKQIVYEKSEMFECATALATSIRLAKILIEREMHLLKDAYKHGQNNGYMYRDGSCNLINEETFCEIYLNQ